MPDVTHILSQINEGDPNAAEHLLPLVYNELRRLAAAKLAREKSGQTLQATALVHEAYLRMVGSGSKQNWNTRGHFFASAAEAMRRILVEVARRKQTGKRGGNCVRVDNELDDLPKIVVGIDPIEVLAIHEALELLSQNSPRKAELVKCRYFLGCTLAESAEILGIAQATAEEDWTYAKAWLRRQLRRDADKSSDFLK